MPLSWKRKPKSEKNRKEKQQHYTEQVAYKLYQNRCLRNQSEDAKSDWEMAEKIAKSPLGRVLFTCHQPFIKLEKLIWEPILTWADNQALLSLLGVIGNVGLIIAVGMYIGSEKQRRDAEVLTAWQTLTNAYGQPGNGGRIKALEFLNASPRNREYDYHGANWRRRAICLWICTWPSESLAGIDLSADEVEIPAQANLRRVYLARVQLPKASLGSANLEGADLRSANLEGASLGSANLAKVDLEGANLKKASLLFTNLEGANLGFANLEGADLGSANLKQVSLRSANLEGADLGSTNLERADLVKANLEETDLGFTNLKRANLIDANLKRADLVKANLEEAYLGSANLERAYLVEANLTRIFLRSANLEGANLGSANLERADLVGANFKRTYLVDANLEEADLRATNFERADLRAANLEGANLMDANLQRTLALTQQQISQAKLCRTILPTKISLAPNRDYQELGINQETEERE